MLTVNKCDYQCYVGVIECDNCGLDDEYEGEDFYDIVKQSKDNGWLSRMVDNEWQHFCNKNCQRELNIDREKEKCRQV